MLGKQQPYGQFSNKLLDMDEAIETSESQDFPFYFAY